MIMSNVLIDPVFIDQYNIAPQSFLKNDPSVPAVQVTLGPDVDLTTKEGVRLSSAPSFPQGSGVRRGLSWSGISGLLLSVIFSP